MKILLAVDGSGHSKAAVDEVVRRPLPAGSEVRIISVVDISYYPPVIPGEAIGNVALFVEIQAAAQIRARAAVDAAAKSTGLVQARTPGAACMDLCAKDWVACKDACTGKACDLCDSGHRTCARVCYGDKAVLPPPPRAVPKK